VARAEAYLHAKFHLDPSESDRLAQYTNVTDRQDRQTDRQRADSILQRTVLQTVAQKSLNRHRHNSATVGRINMKFGIMTHFDPLKPSDIQNLMLLKTKMTDDMSTVGILKATEQGTKPVHLTGQSNLT